MKKIKTRVWALMMAVALLMPSGVWAAEEALDLASVYADAESIASWAVPYVQTVTELALMVGGDGFFNPADSMTRAEFATLLSRMQSEQFSYTASVSDVPPGAWYESAVRAVLGERLMDAPDGAFRPGDPVTREEVSVGIACLLKLDTQSSLAALRSQGVTITDLDLAAEANRPALAATYLEGVMVGSAGKLNPTQPIQRQEMAKVIGILYQ